MVGIEGLAGAFFRKIAIGWAFDVGAYLYLESSTNSLRDVFLWYFSVKIVNQATLA